MGKFGSPHKLCIIRTLEFVYFSFLGSFYAGPMGKFGSPHKLCIIRTLEFVSMFFLFVVTLLGPMGKLGSPHKLYIIRTLEWYIFPFLGGHAMCAPWVNLEVPINCVLLEHWNLYIFPFLGAFYAGPMGKFESRHKFCIIKTLEWYIFPFLGYSTKARWVIRSTPNANVCEYCASLSVIVYARVRQKLTI